jgi:uncharacterized phage protein gp47/JayE
MSFAELLTPRTEPQALAALTTKLASRDLSPTGWSRESVQYSLLDLFSRADAAFTITRSDVARGAARHLVMQIADVATRDAWLDVIALGFYDLRRFPARAATHAFSVTSTSAASPVDLVPRARVVTTEDGIQFRNTGRRSGALEADPSVIRLLPGASHLLEFEAVVPGESGNIGFSVPLTFAQAIAGVTVSNNTSLIGTSILTRGLDAELSESLNARCSQRWDRTAVAQLPGALGEWIHEAFTSAGLTSPIIKWIIDDANPNGPGSVDAYMAEIGVTSAATLARVAAYLQARRSLGAGYYRTLAAEDVTITPAITLYTLGNSSTNTTDLTTALDLLELIEPLGGSFFASDIVKAARSIPDVYDVETDFTTISLAPYQRLVIAPVITEK